MAIRQAATRKNDDIRLLADGVVVAASVLGENVLLDPLFHVALSRKSQARTFIAVAVDDDLSLHDLCLLDWAGRRIVRRRTTQFLLLLKLIEPLLHVVV